MRHGLQYRLGCFAIIFILIGVIIGLFQWGSYAIERYHEPYVAIEQFIEDAKQGKETSSLLAGETEWSRLDVSPFKKYRKPLDWQAFQNFIQHSEYVWYEMESEPRLWEKLTEYGREAVNEVMPFYYSEERYGKKDYVHLLLQRIDGEWKVVGTTAGTTVRDVVMMEHGW